MTKRSLSAVLMLGLMVVVSGVCAQGDTEKGRLLAETCMGCHAIEGYYNVYPTYRVPKLGGQSAKYIENALTAYKTGTRQHPTMHANASNLSEQNIIDIAAFLNGLHQMQLKEGFPEDLPDDEPEEGTFEYKVAQCKNCHGHDGYMPIAADNPVLVGQHADYLQQAMRAYMSGRRQNPIMGLTLEALELSEDDIEQLAEYFSTRTGLVSLDN